MSLPTKSELYRSYNKGNIYENSMKINDCITLNIHKNANLPFPEDSSTNFNETKANLKLDYIYNNKSTKKSVMQMPNNMLYGITRDNPYPFSDNYRNHISSNENPLNNRLNGNKNINANQIMNNYNKYYYINNNVTQQNSQNEENIIAAPTPVQIRNSDNISGPKINKEENYLKENKKNTCWKITKIILIILLIIPLLFCILFLMAHSNSINFENICRDCHCNSDCNCNCSCCSKKNENKK